MKPRTVRRWRRIWLNSDGSRSARLLDAPLVVGDGAADRNAGEVVEQRQHRIQHMAADILEVHVDARRHRRAQLVRKISHAMIQRHVHAQRLQIARFGLTGDGDHARARSLASCATVAPTGPVAAATTNVSPGFRRAISCRLE